MDFQPVLDSLGKIVRDLIDFIPRLVNGLIILVVGLLISFLIRAIVRFVFRRIGLNQLADRAGISRVLQDLKIRVTLSEALAQLIFYYLVISFATEAMHLIQLQSVAELLTNLLRFIPSAVSAAVIIILGSMFARFLGNTITAVADNVNITYSRGLGKIVEYAILAFVVILAVSTLGIDISILTSSMTIIVASVGLAIALTFGLGSRETARNVIAGYSVQQKLGTGQQVSFGEYSGTIRSTSGAYTVVEVTNEQGEAEDLVVPSSMLLERLIRVKRNPGNDIEDIPPASPTE
jgi:small-conductance mechanosensitive channel